jgi:ferredoxin-NADP reductase
MFVMTDYQSTLLGRTEVAEGTMAFQFEKPRAFVFKAGQYIDVTLTGCQPQRDPSDRLTHTFSIASSPLEDKLLLTTRMRDTPFKRVMSTLAIGSTVEIGEAMGSFSLHNNTARPAVFIAGGIGIAPFLSMLTYATEERLGHQIVLFYVNRYLKDAAFIDALWRLETANPRFRFVPTLTRINSETGDWKGIRGHISQEMLLTRIKTLRGPIYYIAGPPTMVASTWQTLRTAGVDEHNIRTDSFAGY